MDLGDGRLGQTTTLLGGASASGGQVETVSGGPQGSTPSTSTSAGASPTEATGQVVLSEPQTRTTSEASPETVSGAGVGATAFTAATGGLTATLVGDGSVAIGFETKAMAIASPETMGPSGTVSDPFTETTATNHTVVGGSTFGKDRLGEPGNFATPMGISPTLSDSLSEAFGGETTTLETSVNEAPSLSKAIAGEIQQIVSSVKLADSLAEAFGGETTVLQMNPVSGIRFLPDWAIGEGIGRIIGTTTEEIRTWDTLELTIRTDKSTVVEEIRPLIDGTGKVDIIERIDGGFDVMDRQGNNGIYLTPPTNRTHVRPINRWYLQNVEEEPQGTDAESYEVTLELTPEQEKSGDS